MKPIPKLDIEALYVALDRKRRHKHKRWRDIASESGVSPSTLTRIGHGYRPDADGLVRLLVWLDVTDISSFIIFDQLEDSE